MTSDVAKKEQLASARATASQIRQGIHNYLHTLALIAKAWEREDWRTLDYGSWQSYVDGEFGEERLKLPTEHRRKAVEELRLLGMSQRAIGVALNVGQSTIRDDLQVSGSTHLTESKGTDGKSYAASRPETPARRDPDPAPGSAVATPGGPAVDQSSATTEEADGQPASPGPATGPREASTEVAPSAEAAGSSPDGDGLAVGQPAGDSHSSSEALGVPAVAPGAAGSSVEVSGETSTDGVEELRVPALQPDSSGAAGAPAHFPAAGAPDPAAEPLAGEPYDSLAAAFEYALIDKPGCRHDDVATCPVCLAGVAVHVLRDHVLDVLADDDRYHDWYRDNVEQLDEVDEDMSHAATVAHYLVDVVLPRSAT